MKAISSVLLLAAAVAFAPGETAAHHGKKEEHAQPAAVRSGCTWTHGQKKYTSLAACMKRGADKGSCRSACK